MRHLTTTAMDRRQSDAFGPTYRGVICQDRTYLNDVLYARARFACKSGEVNTAVTENVNVWKNFEIVERFFNLSPDDLQNAGELHIAPLTSEGIKSGMSYSHLSPLNDLWLPKS
ncbi:hypothetical protein Golomagni_04477 [Golovinomyces magnicellulatus]|nr:hypothetical protein Golomagni_04477 [Golovinomyces magnicellulatus]